MRRKRYRIDPNTIVLLKQIFIGFLAIGTVVLLIYGVWYGTRLPAVIIDEIVVSGGETVDHEEIEAMASRSLQGTYVGLIPKTFTWFYPKGTITEKVSEVDRVYDVRVRREKTQVFVDFKEYIPYALWCEEIGSAQDCHFLDKNALAFAEAPALIGGAFVRFVIVGVDKESGKHISDLETFQLANEVVEQLSTINWFVSEVEMDTVGDASYFLVDGGELKVSFSDSPEEILENLKVVLSSPEFEHIKPGNFQYIDLRFGSKVFVNEETATFTEATVESGESSTSSDRQF